MADREYSLPEIADDVRQLVRQFEAFRREFTQDHVRKDVYDAEKRAMEAEIRAIRSDHDALELKQQLNFRLAVTAIIGPIVVGLVLWVLLRQGP